jgi:hypothetical protein
MRVPRLRCVSCGLVYEQAAIARHLPLATGCPCRRCGGELRPEDARSVKLGRRTPVVVAVRSAVTGQARLPYG